MLSAYEHGRRQPSVSALARIARAAGLELEISPLADADALERAGEVLIQVLELADRMPSKQRGELDLPAADPAGVVIGVADRMLAVHDALRAAGLPHAIGGAIALGYCTLEARGTQDVDVNVFVAPSRTREVLAALPDGVRVTREGSRGRRT